MLARRSRSRPRAEPNLDRRSCQPQIGCVELRLPDQTVPIANLNGASFPFDQFRGPELGYGTINVDFRQSKDVCKHGLADRKFHLAASRAMDDLQPEIEFAQEMGEPRHRCPPSKTRDPLPMHGGVDQGIQPEQTGEMGFRLRQPAQALMRRPRDCAAGQGDHPMIHRAHHQTVKIDEVAWHVQLRDLPRAVRQHDITCGEPIEDQGAEPGRRMLTDDIRPRRYDDRGLQQFFQNPRLGCGKFVTTRQLLDQGADQDGLLEPGCALDNPPVWDAFRRAPLSLIISG